MWMLPSSKRFIDVFLSPQNGGTLITAQNFYFRQVPVHLLTNTSLSRMLLRLGLCASKGALDGLTRVMANELGRKSVRVNGVHPVVTLTQMAVKAWSDSAKFNPMLARIPLRRFLQPEEVAAAIAYLLSDAAAMVNGISMPVDGAFLINLSFFEFGGLSGTGKVLPNASHKAAAYGSWIYSAST